MENPSKQEVLLLVIFILKEKNALEKMKKSRAENVMAYAVDGQIVSCSLTFLKSTLQKMED